MVLSLLLRSFNSCMRGKGTRTTGAILALYVVTFMIVLPFLCRDWPYSKYFQGEGNAKHIISAVHAQNDLRKKIATSYFSTLDRKVNDGFYKYAEYDESDIAVGVITMKRENGNALYLTQTLASADMSLKQNTSYKKPILFLCNVDPEPLKHQEAVDLAKYFHSHAHYDDKGIKPDQDRFEKEKEDYSFCLIKALSYQPKYVLLLEDDAQPRNNFFDNLKYLIDNRINHHSHYDEGSGDHLMDWFLVKLYYPEKWIGYGNEIDKIMELLALGCVGGILFYLFIQLPQSFILGALYFIILAFLVGRQYFVHLRRISVYFYRVLPAPGCCTQAVLYTKASARQVAHHLSTVTCTVDFSVDLAIDALVYQHGGLSYVVEPNLVRHIGMVSTVRRTKKAAEFLE